MPPKNKAVLLNVVSRAVELYEKENKSFEVIATILKNEGFDISKSSIHRAVKTFNEAAAKYKQVSEETKTLLEAVKNNPTTDMMEGVHAILANHLFQYITSIDELQFEDPGELILAINRLSRTSGLLTKFRMENANKAAAQIEAEGVKRNIDPEFLEMIKKQFFGIN